MDYLAILFCITNAVLMFLAGYGAVSLVSDVSRFGWTGKHCTCHRRNDGKLVRE
jgi:hypothetical protein